MGTRSTIALEFADGTVEQVYCHWDGYLSNNGKILQAHYMDPFEQAYTQRGEELCVNKYKNADEYFDCCQQEEYDYILRNINGVATWFVRFYANEGVWVTLDEAFAKEAETVDA
jgi:hypothetical protein